MILRQATAAEAVERDKLTFFEWGTKLTLEQYFARERRLRDHPFARRGLRLWLLVDDSGEVLSSCETLTMRSLVRAGDAWVQGETQGIASVFTEERLRGKGHAVEMIRRVVERLSGDQTHSFILFSEVGAKLYERAGFELRPSYDRIFRCNSTRTNHPSLRMLTRGQALVEWERQVPLARESFLVWPTADQVDWNFEREDAYATLLNGPRAEFQGAALDQSLVLWMVDHKKGCLQLVCLRSKTSLEAQVLITKACETARELGLPCVRAWETEAFDGWDRLGHASERELREGSLTMIRPVNPKLKSSEWNFIPRAVWL